MPGAPRRYYPQILGALLTPDIYIRFEQILVDETLIKLRVSRAPGLFIKFLNIEITNHRIKKERQTTKARVCQESRVVGNV